MSVKLFLDSGAYSAHYRKSEIDIDDYIVFIKQNEEYLEVYANLDVIGSDEGTYENQMYMEEKGLLPMPVYHHGDDLKYLRYYLENYEYLALGGAAGSLTGDKLIRWLDHLWSEFLTDEDGVSKVKIHGFGMTAVRLLLRYPWYSVDSTSWIRAGSFGSVLIPPPLPRGKGYNYNKTPHVLSISTESPKINQEGKHFVSYTKEIQKVIQKYIKEKGFTLKQLESDYCSRIELNVEYFVDVTSHKKTIPFEGVVRNKRFF